MNDDTNEFSDENKSETAVEIFWLLDICNALVIFAYDPVRDRFTYKGKDIDHYIMHKFHTWVGRRLRE
jgi:hypothetical protein